MFKILQPISLFLGHKNLRIWNELIVAILKFIFLMCVVLMDFVAYKAGNMSDCRLMLINNVWFQAPKVAAHLTFGYLKRLMRGPVHSVSQGAFRLLTNHGYSG